MASVPGFLLRRWGGRKWDLVLRGTAVAALAAVPTVLIFPGSAVLVSLALLSLPVNGPLSPILPAAFEPLVMEAAKHEAALSVTLVALAAYMYAEYLDYHLYAWLLSLERFASLQRRRSVRWGMGRFARAPFSTVLVFAFAPLPFWVARCLAILHRYPLRRFMAATAVGRLPRIFAYAWFGAQLQVSGTILLGVAVGTAAIAVGWRLVRGEPVLSDTVFGAEAGCVAPSAPEAVVEGRWPR